MSLRIYLPNVLPVVLSALLAVLLSAAAQAAVSEQEAAQLGDSLTPVGAEKAGSADGRIPAWTGGMEKREMERGEDPFADDEPLLTITHANYKEHAAHLSKGHQQLFETYPDSYKMLIYPTRRSGAYPDYVYENTRNNATRVELTNDGFGFSGAAQGYPFPIPKSGIEVLWNHVMRYNTLGWNGYINNAVTTPDGDYVVERAYIQVAYIYNHPETTVDTLDNQNLFVLSKVVAPPNKAGDAYLVHVPLDRVGQNTDVWIFNPAQGRVRRIGEVGYDNPAFDGLMTHDQIDMFNGPPDRYTVKLIGKQDMYVPYNSYKLYSDKVKYEDIITKGHINQDLARYELHRMWVIEATVREGFAHSYKRRTFYLDEDSWLVLLQDMYDDRDQFWRTSEAHAITWADIPVVVNGVQVHYDTQSRRYVILNLSNEEKDVIEYDWWKPPKYFSTRELQKFARRY